MRKLFWMLLSFVVWLPGAVYGLGLGELKLHSALNQPLDAEIGLLSVEPRDVDTIRVELGSYEVFSQVGIERPAVLMLLDFEVAVDSAGKPYIRVSSKKAIREPFLDFVIDVQWRAGRLVREYTLLLDPPEMAARPAPAVQAAAVEAPAEVAAPAAVTPVTGRMAPVSAPAAAGGLRYGPISADDTLWSIARQLRPDRSVSVHQVMMALYRNNSHAFLGNNINRLKKGTVLRIDDMAELRAMSRAEAYREVVRHNSEWEQYRREAAMGAAERRIGKGAAPEVAAAVATPEQPRLRLAAPEGKDAEAAKRAGAGETAEPGEMHRETTLTLEGSEALRRENADLRQRSEQLEEQIKTLQELLTLKDEDLAALQQQLRTGLPAEETVAEEAVVVPEEVEAAAAAEVVEAVSEPVPAAEPAAAPERQKPQPPKPPVASPPAPAGQPGFIETLMADTMTMGIIGGVFVLVLILALLIVRRRRQGEFQESILTGTHSSSMVSGGESMTSETSFFSDLASEAAGVSKESEVDPLTEADVYMAYGRHKQAEELLKDAIAAAPDRHELRVKLLEVYFNAKNSADFETCAQEAHDVMGGAGELWDKVLVMGHELCPDNALFSAVPEGVSIEQALEGTEETAAAEEVFDIGLDIDELAKEMEDAGMASEEEFNFDLGLDFSDLEEELGLSEEKTAKAQPEETSEITPEPSSEAAPVEEPMETAESDLGFDLNDLQFGAEAEELAEEAPHAPQVDEAAGEGLASEEEDASPEEAGLDFDLGDLELAAESEAIGEEAGAPGEAAEEEGEVEAFGDLDFDLSGMDLGSEAETTVEEPAVAEQESPAEDEGLAFDVGDLDFVTEEAADEEPGEEMPGLDFDLGELEAGIEASLSEEEPAQVNEEPAAEAEFSLADFDELESAAEQPEAAGEEEAGLDFDPSDFDLGEVEAASEQISDESFEDIDLLDMGEEADFGDLGDMDEVGTKLDLARAYVDMGDAEAARSSLEEVIANGDDEQKRQAEELLKQLEA